MRGERTAAPGSPWQFARTATGFYDRVVECMVIPSSTGMQLRGDKDQVQDLVKLGR